MWVIHSDTQVSIPYTMDHYTIGDVIITLRESINMASSTTVMIRRNNVLASAEAAFGRLRNFSFNTLLNVEFVGETAVDNDGPRRELLW